VDRQPLEIQTLYAELLERLAAAEAERAIGHAQGSFVTKCVKGRDYYYFQHSDPGGTKRQTYIGKKDQALDAVVRRFEQSRDEIASDLRSIDRLASLLRVGGAMRTDAPSARVLRALADSGVFCQGAVLVGTHAFVVIGNVLGVRWSGSALRTQDVDVAASPHMSVAVPAMRADVPGALEGLEMGFVPVPSMNRTSASTSFKVRGAALRVDLVTPAAYTGGKPVDLPALAASAQPLRFLDYIMEGWVSAAVVDGGAVSVNVPDPARFALHKLVVAAERPAVMHTKREKDLWQSSQVLEALLEDRPGDVELAWDALVRRGPGWVRRVTDSLGGLERVSPVVHRELHTLMGT
jgi:hypothetical protein